MSRRIPKYRKHSTRDYAIVQWHGKRKSLPGKFNSTESRAAYAAFLRKISTDAPADAEPVTSDDSTVDDLCLLFLNWALPYYGGNKEYDHLRDVTEVLGWKWGGIQTSDFGPARLKAVRDAMISGEWALPSRPWSRSHINHQVSRLRRIFKWGVEHEIVKPSVLAALQAVSPLRKGRSAARETSPVKPVAPEDVAAVLPFLGRVVADMVLLQQATGMRSQNLCLLRPEEIDRSGNIWVYRPSQHKTAWIGVELEIFLGPKAQAILLPYLSRTEDAYCFSPVESEQLRTDARRMARKTPVQPSQQSRKKQHPKRPKRDHYTPYSYRRAIWYGFEKGDKARAKEAKETGTKPTVRAIITFFNPPPRRAAVTKASNIMGKAIKASTRRMMMMLNQPPR